MTVEEARSLREDIINVIVHVASDPNGDYLITHPQGTTLRVLKHSLPRFGYGEQVTAEHLAN